MKIVPVIHSSLLRPFAKFMIQNGVAIERNYASSRIPLEARDDLDLIIPERPLWRLLEILRDREQVPDIGFKIAARTHLYELPGILAELKGARNLLELLLRYVRATRRFANDKTYSLLWGRDSIRFRRKPSPIDCGQWPMEQIALYSMIDIVRLALGPNWWPAGIELVHDKDMEKEEREWLRDTAIQSGKDRTSITISRKDMYSPLDLRITIPGKSQATAMPESVNESLTALLPYYLDDNRLNLARVSDIVGVAPRTLQHWLTSEKATFQGIIDRVRFDHARELLQGRELRVSEVARMIGYTSPAAFARAFSKWAGMPPSAFSKMY